jgi:putative Mg2+ transporter-C (MgtC) family protein
LFDGSILTHCAAEITLDYDYIIMFAVHLTGALILGGAIGLERTLHGHPAGFRTHSLVCLASSLLMLVTFYQGKWPSVVAMEAVRTDPIRMAQGIMTGIGFLGAGAIFKEGLTVRGLTTAASIWITAAIGILVGIGFYYPAILATILTLGVLSLFRTVESRLPSQSYAHHFLRFDRDNVMPEEEVKGLLSSHGFDIANMGYRITEAGQFEYRMVVRTSDPSNVSRLVAVLRDNPLLRGFRISRIDD